MIKNRRPRRRLHPLPRRCLQGTEQVRSKECRNGRSEPEPVMEEYIETGCTDESP